jgi:hypothetical protein
MVVVAVVLLPLLYLGYVSVRLLLLRMIHADSLALCSTYIDKVGLPFSMTGSRRFRSTDFLLFIRPASSSSSFCL